MKEHDYTPGPWHVSNEGKLVIRDDEWLVPVATAGYATNDEELATAKLIAAAPDLLEALQSILELQTRGYVVLGDKYTDMARAAISKALVGGVMDWKVIEKDNPLAVHFITHSEERCKWWIETYGDSKCFMNKQLSRLSLTYLRTK